MEPCSNHLGVHPGRRGSPRLFVYSQSFHCQISIEVISYHHSVVSLISMDANTLATIRQKLLEERDRLEKELRSLGTRPNINSTSDIDFPQFGDKEDENAAEVALFGDNLSLEQNCENELRDVNNALYRLEQGTYGVCKYCKKEIPINRLLARPASSSCIACKEKLSKM